MVKKRRYIQYLKEGLGVDPTEMVSTSGPESERSSSSLIRSSISSGSTSPTCWEGECINYGNQVMFLKKHDWDGTNLKGELKALSYQTRTAYMDG